MFYRKNDLFNKLRIWFREWCLVFQQFRKTVKQCVFAHVRS